MKDVGEKKVCNISVWKKAYFTPSLWNDSRIIIKYEDDEACGRVCGADVVEGFGIAGY